MENLCKSCIHSVVCKHSEKYKQYIEEMEELSKKYDIFEQAPECKLYKKENNYTIRGVDLSDMLKNSSKDNLDKTNIFDRSPMKTKEKPIKIDVKDNKTFTTLDLYEKVKDKDIPEFIKEMLKNEKPEKYKNEEEFNETLNDLCKIEEQYKNMNYFEKILFESIIKSTWNTKSI